MSAAPAVEEKPVAKPTNAAKIGRDLVVQNQGNAAVPMPQNYAQMTDMALMMSKGGAMVGSVFRDNPGACLGVLVQAMRWGMEPYAVSQKCYVASKTGDGPIAYEGQLVHAVILKNAPLQKRLRCTYEGDGDDRRIVVSGLLVGEDEASEYRSPPVAKLRKPVGKGSPLWYDDPDQQLWYYGVRAWTRKWCPDVLMGVYTPDELADVRPATEAGAEQVITLSGAAVERVREEQAADAEFTSVDALLNKNPPAKEKAASPKTDDREADGGGADVGAETAARDTEGDQGQTATVEAEAGSDDGPSDEEIVGKVEAALKVTKTGRAEIIRAERGALTRIAETSEDQALRKRALGLLNRYDLD